MNTVRVRFFAEPVVRPARAGRPMPPEWRLMIAIGVMGEQPGDWRVAVRAATLADTEAHPAEYQAYLAGDEPREMPAAPEPPDHPEGEALFAEIIHLNRCIMEVCRRIDAAPFAPAAYRERVRLWDAFDAAEAAYHEHLRGRRARATG